VGIWGLMGLVRVPTRTKKGLLFIVNLHQRRRYGEVWILDSLCFVPILGQVGMIRSRMGMWDGTRKKRSLYINAYVTNAFYRINLTGTSMFMNIRQLMILSLAIRLGH
jgi:hypothetical protein